MAMLCENTVMVVGESVKWVGARLRDVGSLFSSLPCMMLHAASVRQRALDIFGSKRVWLSYTDCHSESHTRLTRYLFGENKGCRINC